MVERCRDILMCWRDRRLKFPNFSNVAKNTFCVTATSGAREQVFNMAGMS